MSAAFKKQILSIVISRKAFKTTISSLTAEKPNFIQEVLQTTLNQYLFACLAYDDVHPPFATAEITASERKDKANFGNFIFAVYMLKQDIYTLRLLTA